MGLTHTPFYIDWTFWAVIMSAIAILLSQLPPVKLWFRGSSVDVDPYSMIHLSHKVGNPNLQLQLVLTNTAGRDTIVTGISLDVSRDGKTVARLNATTYLENPNDKTAVLFTRFSLKPGQEWSHIVNFFSFFSRDVQKKYKAAEHSIKEEISSKRARPENKDRLVEAKHSLVEPFLQLYDQHFIWTPGEYHIVLTLRQRDQRNDVKREYWFALFESESTELAQSRDDYKFGDGIFYDSGKHPGVVIPIAS